jgi:hypothetical protein
MPASGGAFLAVCNVLLLAVNECPNFVDLNTLAGQPDEHTILIPRGGSAGINQKAAYGLLARAREPRHGTNGSIGVPAAPRFRTIQVCPKDLPPGLREIELAANRPIGPSSWRTDDADF